MAKMSETQLAHTVISWLEDMGWDVYQEVQIYRGGCRADIVAINKPKVAIIETKLHYGFSVWEQALGWIRCAHYVSIAVPARKGAAGIRIGAKLHTLTGIGLIELSRGGLIKETFAPRLNRRADSDRILKALKPEHKTFAAAGSNGSYWTTFGDTRKRFVRMVHEQPGLTMKELIDQMGKCHYATRGSARISLASWVREGVIKGVKIRCNGRRKEYWPDQTE